MIKVKDVAFARVSAPDLEAMERFLTDFGLVVTARSSGALYCRGTDPSPYLHVTERGEPGFRGLAFEAASAEDLAAAATLEGASAVEKIDAPGGGQRVCFRDPDGFAVEVARSSSRCRCAVRSRSTGAASARGWGGSSGCRRVLPA